MHALPEATAAPQSLQALFELLHGPDLYIDILYRDSAHLLGQKAMVYGA